MNMDSVFRASLRAVLLLLALAAAAPVIAQAPSDPPPAHVRKDRIFLKDIEGIWINEPYLGVLSALKSPHAAAKKTAPLVIAIRRDGRAFPIVVTDFNKATLQAVLDIEPDGKPGAYRLVVARDDKPTSGNDVKFIRFEAARNAQGKIDRLRIAEPDFMKGKWADYVPLTGELSPQMNRFVLSGKYEDDKGRPWTFSEAGEATWPDRTFNYELSLNDPGAGCDYLQTESGSKPEAAKSGAQDDKNRFGYRWKDGKLSILPARLAGKKVVCDAKPVAVLTPK
jgi:hypothetical protein